MNIANVYGKSLTFFSRSRQERIVSSIERDFYEAVTIYAKDDRNTSQLNLKLEETFNNIRHHVTHSYFEDDLLEHMFNLLTFVTNYMDELKATYPEKNLGVPKVRITK